MLALSTPYGDICNPELEKHGMCCCTRNATHITGS